MATSRWQNVDGAFAGAPDEAAFWTGRTFDDFLFRPQKSDSQTRRNISVSSLLTADVALDLPIVSSNMDSVTGAHMARAMAMHGGIGVVHRGMSIERQASEVGVVKRSQSAVIVRPLCLPAGTTIRQARRFARQNGITGILIETASGSNLLAGLLSNRDTPVHGADEDRPVDDFMTPLSRLVTGAPDISTDEAERVMFEHRIERLPLVDGRANRIRGLITRRDINLKREQPGASKDSAGHLRCAAAVGARGDYLERAAALLEAGADLLFIDIAHGHSVVMEQAVAGLRGKFGSVPLVCGNVATGAGARFLRDIGADAVKVGVGPGRGCRTRLETAAGVPQLQAIREAYLAVGGSVPIMADGGVRTDKDIFLALICGASTVMLGSALSGTDEAPGRVIEDPATHLKKKIYRGMTSPEAVLETLYDSSSEELDAALETPPEGQEIQVPYRGSVSGILERIRGHLQSSVSYGGEITLAALREKVLPDPSAFLVPLSAAARSESYER